MIVIRPMLECDIPFFNEVRNQSRNFLHNDSYFTVEQSLSWFKDTNPRFFIIWTNNENIGYFRTSNWADGSCYIGADIHEKFRGKGYAKMAYPLFMDLLYDECGIKTFYLEVIESNIVANNLYKQIGFSEVAREKEDVVRNDQKLDSIKMKLDYVSRKIHISKLEAIVTPQGSLFPFYKDWEEWHNGHEVKMAYLTTMKPGTYKGPILHQKRQAMITAVSGIIEIQMLLGGERQSCYLRDSVGQSNRVVVPANTPMSIRNLSPDQEGMILNFPNKAWHPDDEDTYKFDDWDNYAIRRLTRSTL